MLPPTLMLTIKNQAAKSLIFCLAAGMLLTACGPAGPRALLAGKKLLEQGKYDAAIAKLTTATRLLGTNALAYSYLGLACHQAGKLPEAEQAYQQALALDPDLVEVRYNLGCVWLSENKVEQAKSTLTAYTLRRPASADGWLKLGSAQLRAGQSGAAYARPGELMAAERSFNEAIRLNPSNPEALTGIGLVRAGRNRPAEAAQFFERAMKEQPSYAPALLNLAIVAQEQLNDRQLALAKYREYLALKPTPENATEVKAIVRQLEQELAPPAVVAPTRSPVTNVAVQPAPAMASNKSLAAEPNRSSPPPSKTVTNVVHRALPSSVETMVVAARQIPVTNAAKSSPAPVPTLPTNLEVARVPAEPVIKAAQDDPPAAPTTAVAASDHSEPASPPRLLATAKEPKRSLFQRLNPFGSRAADPKLAARTTPLSGTASSANQPEDSVANPAEGTMGSGARYVYQNPAQPLPGNRAEAERAFAQGVQAQRAQRLPEALQAYRSALHADPSFFDAWYNLGLTATEAGNLQSALSGYESALALRPQSLDARYNFALVLKQANYPLDAARELEKVLAIYPNDSRSHLALGNLYAQQLGQPAKARAHYVKVLESDPRNPQAGAIRYWLTDTAH